MMAPDPFYVIPPDIHPSLTIGAYRRSRQHRGLEARAAALEARARVSGRRGDARRAARARAALA